MKLSQAIDALEFEAEVDEEHMPIAAVVLLKVMDEDGDFLWYQRFSKTLSNTEGLGVLYQACETQKSYVVGTFKEDD